MENAHLRLGLLEYVRITEKASTRIRLRVDRYIDRQHRDSPTSARIVLDLLKWGKNPEGDCTVTVQFWSDF